MNVILQKSSAAQRDIPSSHQFAEFTREAVEQSIPKRFEERAEKYPQRLAVKTRSETFTYESLNERANQIAEVLLTRVMSGDDGKEPVALFLEKGAQMLAATLGALKAGMPQVFLDPLFPPSRNRALLGDSGAKLILTNSKNILPANDFVFSHSRLMNIDEIGSGTCPKNPNLVIAPDALAYILYTSGSTGVPKGVRILHRTLLHRAMRQTNSYRITPNDRLSHLASFSTGQGLVNIFSALLNGAALFPLDVKSEGLERLAMWLIDGQITIYRSSASVFRYFVKTLNENHQFPHLRLVRLASEQVTKQDIELCRKHFGSECVIVNGLSTSETGTICEYQIDQTTDISGDLVPIGYPVSDMGVLLLDESGRRSACGEVGEIAVRSRYLAQGYWRRPELTQAAFLSCEDDDRERIYLTGDLGKELPGGLLVHYGRKDFQVKIRGHRVEIAEIESALQKLPAVEGAVVLARKDLRREQSLVAYLVLDQKSSYDTSEVRRSLAEKLPDYMMPASFVVLDAFPVTPAGKIDRLALLSIDPPLLSPIADGTESFSDAEKVLARIWSEVLLVGGIDRKTNFFFIGGHSLLATQVVSRINATFQINLPLESLFEMPLLDDLALNIEEKILDEIESMREEEAVRLIGLEAANSREG